MPEGNENAAGSLPGGFESPEKMYEALEALKSDLSQHKTRASELKALQDKLATYESEAEKRKQSEMTELEKAQARIAALEGDLTAKEQAILKAQRDMLLERVLSKKLSAVPEGHRELVRMAYERAALGEFDDEETLNALLDPVDEHVKTLVQPAPTGGVRPQTGPLSSPGGRKDPQAAAAAKDWLSMTFTEKQRMAREKKKR